MTKRKITLSILVLFIAVISWQRQSRDNDLVSEARETVITKADTKTDNLIEITNKNTDRAPSSIRPVNKGSKDWEKKLHTSLEIQAGSYVKSIEITKERTFTYTWDQTPLEAHSVRVEMKNHKDESSSFRAIVDASTGKILETFDRTQFDQIGHNHKPLTIKAEPFFQ